MPAAPSPSAPPLVTHDVEVGVYDLDASVVSFEATVGDDVLRLELEQEGAALSDVYLALGGGSGDCLHLSGNVWPKLRTISALVAAAERDYSRLASRAQALVAAARAARERSRI